MSPGGRQSTAGSVHLERHAPSELQDDEKERSIEEHAEGVTLSPPME